MTIARCVGRVGSGNIRFKRNQELLHERVRRVSGEVLQDALKASKSGSQALELLVENTDYYKTFKIDYHGGEKYPHLVRDESKPDILTEIIKPH